MDRTLVVGINRGEIVILPKYSRETEKMPVNLVEGGQSLVQ